MLQQATLVVGLMALAAPALAEPTEVGVSPCNYGADDARRIDFLAAYREAHLAELGAWCVVDNPAVERLKAELQTISNRAQARNPDIDLSTLEGQTALDVCRIPAGDMQSGCEATDALAITKFSQAMTELRKFTKKWR